MNTLIDRSNTVQFNVKSTYVYGAPWSGPHTSTVYWSQTHQNIKYKASVTEGKFVPNVYRINPYSVSRGSWHLQYSTVDINLTSGDWFFNFSDAGHLGCKPMVAIVGSLPPPDPGNAPEIALQQALGAVGQECVGLGENLGELRETLDMLRNPFKNLRDFLVSANYRKLGQLNKLIHYRNSGRWSGTKKGDAIAAANAAASSWLELRYGLMPLIYTAQDVIDLVNKKALPFDENQILTAKGKYRRKDDESIPKTWAYYRIEYNGNIRVTSSYTCYANVHYNLSGALHISQVLGLSPSYLPQLMWELTRLSFVVDWIVTIGPWIESLRMTPQANLLGNTVGTKVTRKVSGSARATCTYSGQTKSTSVDKLGHYEYESYDRTVNQDPPLIPLLKLDALSYNRTLDALALIIRPLTNKLRR